MVNCGGLIYDIKGSGYIDKSVSPKETIAFIDYNNYDEFKKYAEIIIDECINVAIKQGFMVADRQKLDALLKEHELVSSEFFSRKTIQEMGKFAGIKYLGIINVGTSNGIKRGIFEYVTIRIIEVKTASVKGIFTYWGHSGFEKAEEQDKFSSDTKGVYKQDNNKVFEDKSEFAELLTDLFEETFKK